MIKSTRGRIEVQRHLITISGSSAGHRPVVSAQSRPFGGYPPIARLQPLVHGGIPLRDMHVERAYAERESLSNHDLERLRASLVDQVQRHEDAIRGYSPEKMEKHGQPFLARLRQKVADVDATIRSRGNGS